MEPELIFKIGNYTYQIIAQNTYEYAIKVIEKDSCYWIKYPESRFETTGGAMYAILKDLEDKLS